MYPILSEEEYSNLKKLDSKFEIDQYIEEYWKNVDPDPETEENEIRDIFEQRLKYANDNFPDKRGFGRSDMKKIFLRFGKPDFIERKKYENISIGRWAKANSVIVWVYNTPAKHNKFYAEYESLFKDQMRFAFADTFGAGFYRLINSTEELTDIDNRFY